MCHFFFFVAPDKRETEMTAALGRDCKLKRSSGTLKERKGKTITETNMAALSVSLTINAWLPL